jgi:hypothetical protein
VNIHGEDVSLSLQLVPDSFAMRLSMDCAA